LLLPTAAVDFQVAYFSLTTPHEARKCRVDQSSFTLISKVLAEAKSFDASFIYVSLIHPVPIHFNLVSSTFTWVVEVSKWKTK
jgi:hypothetical protein